jgi:hypothetical protein
VRLSLIFWREIPKIFNISIVVYLFISRSYTGYIYTHTRRYIMSAHALSATVYWRNLSGTYYIYEPGLASHTHTHTYTYLYIYIYIYYTSILCLRTKEEIKTKYSLFKMPHTRCPHNLFSTILCGRSPSSQKPVMSTK